MVLTRMKKLLCICLLVLLCLSGTAQGQRTLNEPVYLMVQGQLMEQLQVLHSGPRTCTHPSFALEKQEAPDELLCLPLSNFYHRIVTPCILHPVWAASRGCDGKRIPPAPRYAAVRGCAYQRSLSYLL